MKKALLCSILFIFTVSSIAQKEASLWYFGRQSGMNFMKLSTVTNANINGVANQTITGVPSFQKGPINNAWEGCFTLCDKDGEFLFASDGMTVYNGESTTNVMENGTGLFGNPSSAQSGVIVPRPDHPNNYYIVTSDAADIGSGHGICYSEVDLSATNSKGRGTVIYKNKPLDFGGAKLGVNNNGAVIQRKDSYEGVAAYAHPNGKDYWLLNRTRDKFFLWKVTKDGISPSPISSYYAGIDPGPTNSSVKPQANQNAGLGHTKFSANGKLIANSSWGSVNGIHGSHITVGRFNQETGVITDVKTKSLARANGATKYGVIYGIEFSPEAKYLYFTCFQQENYIADLWKINLEQDYNTLAWTALVPKEIKRVVNIGLGPDNRLYAIGGSTNASISHNYLMVFLDPDEGATQRVIIENFFPAANSPMWGLPNFVYSYFGMKPMSGDAIACFNLPANYKLQVSTGTGVNTVARLQWDFGDGSPVVNDDNMNQLDFTQSHTYTKNGEYTVVVTPYNKLANGTYLPINDKKQNYAVNVVDCRCIINPQNRSFYKKE